MFKYIDHIPTADDYNHLRDKIGLETIDVSQAAVGLNNSIKCISVYDGDQFIGMGRIVGDGSLVYVISNIYVCPNYHNQKIGTNIMQLLMDYIDTHHAPSAMVMLMARKDTESFYEKFGFIKRPNRDLGAGMCKYY